MKLKTFAPLLLVVLSLVYFMFLRSNVSEASLLLLNGVVYTVNEAQPRAEAVAVSSGKIIAVGTTTELQSKFTSSHVIDLHGRPVYPGFIDSHAHLEGLGSLLLNLDLTGTTSVEEIQRLVAESAGKAKPGMWIRGRGWDQNQWRHKTFPNHEILDKVAGDIPVYLARVDGHAVWVSKKVLEIAGTTKETPDPEGGKIVRDKAGNPTGVFVDNAVDIVKEALPDPSEVERTEAILKAVQSCLKVGLTEVHDMGVDGEQIEICRRLIQTGRFPFRVYAAIGGPGPLWERYLARGPEIGTYEGRLTVRALKLYADGALGSYGAALIEPYSDDPANRGLTLTSADSIRYHGRRALERGFQVCTHAIGDRANHIVLNVYEELYKANPERSKDARFRVEHAQVLAQDDIARFHQIGVLPMMQPTHCTSDMRWAESRLGPTRIKGAYAWRSLIESGSIVPGSSDFPAESNNPLWGFYAAITRQDRTGWPVGGWYPEQRMTRDEALKAFTIWGATAGFEENIKGSIEPGKFADLVVLSNDIMQIDARDILQTTVEMTIVGGDVVYSAGALAGRER